MTTTTGRPPGLPETRLVLSLPAEGITDGVVYDAERSGQS